MTLTEAMQYRGVTAGQLAEKSGLQVQEIRDMVRRVMVQPAQREQEKWQTEKHRKETTA